MPLVGTWLPLYTLSIGSNYGFWTTPLRVTRLTYGLASFAWFCQKFGKREMVALSKTEQSQPKIILNLLFLLLFDLKIINLSNTTQLRFSCCEFATSFVLPLIEIFFTSFEGFHKSMKLFLNKTKKKNSFQSTSMMKGV